MGTLKTMFGWVDPRSTYSNDQWEPVKTDEIQMQGFNFDPNTKEAYMIPMSRLVDMWQALFGDRWLNSIKGNPELKDTFWADACDRLAHNDMFEKYGDWFRLKEDVCKS